MSRCRAIVPYTRGPHLGVVQPSIPIAMEKPSTAVTVWDGQDTQVFDPFITVKYTG